MYEHEVNFWPGNEAAVLTQRLPPFILKVGPWLKEQHVVIFVITYLTIQIYFCLKALLNWITYVIGCFLAKMLSINHMHFIKLIRHLPNVFVVHVMYLMSSQASCYFPII